MRLVSDVLGSWLLLYVCMVSGFWLNGGPGTPNINLTKQKEISYSTMESDNSQPRPAAQQWKEHAAHEGACVSGIHTTPEVLALHCIMASAPRVRGDLREKYGLTPAHAEAVAVSPSSPPPEREPSAATACMRHSELNPSAVAPDGHTPPMFNMADSSATGDAEKRAAVVDKLKSTADTKYREGEGRPLTCTCHHRALFVVVRALPRIM